MPERGMKLVRVREPLEIQLTRPVSRPSRRSTIFGAAAGTFIELYDFTLYGFFASTIAALFFPSSDPVTGLIATFALFGLSFVIRPIGAVAFGHIGDRFGRRRALMIAIALMSIGTVGIGLLPTYNTAGVASPLLLLVCRLLQGFSDGGEQNGAYVLVGEGARSNRWLSNSSVLTAILLAGITSAIVVSLVVNLTASPVALQSWAWRIPFLFAAPIGLFGLYLRRRVADSAEFQQTRDAQREANVRTLPFAEAFRSAKKPMLVMFCWIAMQAVTTTLFVGFFTTYLTKFRGYSQTSALVIVLISICVAILLIPILGRIGDRISLRPFALSVCVAQAVWVIPTMVLLGDGLPTAIVAAAAYAVLAHSSLTVSGALVISLFPVEIRYTASAVPYQVAFAIFGGGTPLVATTLLRGSSELVFGAVVAVICLAAAAVAAWGIPSERRRGGTALDTHPKQSRVERTAN